MRDRRELLNRATVVFNEVCVTMEMEDVKSVHQGRQREICDALGQKVHMCKLTKAICYSLVEKNIELWGVTSC